MRIVSWNVNHRATEKRIPPDMARAVGALEPDVLVLTEFVPGPSREPFIAALRNLGLGSVLLSDLTPGQNHVLIAARFPVKRGPERAPAIHSAVPPNALHVQLARPRLDVFGLRVPEFSKAPALRRACWDWIAVLASRLLSSPAVLIGDFNTDPTYPAGRCGPRIAALEASGWSRAPATGRSYWTPSGVGVCIDHAFVTPHIAVGGAEYVVDHAGHAFCANGPRGLSDHAALVVDLTLR